MLDATKLEKLLPMPFVRVELVILCVLDARLQVLLSQREEEPFKGMWSLPGGVLRIDQDVSLAAAAKRVSQERLNMVLPNLSQVIAVGDADRDPRARWAISVVFRSLVQVDLDASPGKRVRALKWSPVNDLAGQGSLAFDHACLIEQSVEAVRREIAELRFPMGWAKEPFTYGDLQSISEAVLGVAIDKVTFRRRMDASGVATALKGQMRSGGAFRPAQLYKFASELE